MRASTFQSAQNGLRLIPGDRHVSAGGVRLAHQAAMPSGVGAFVQALMERYNSWQPHQPSLDLVLRQRPSGTTMAPVYYQVQMQVAPRLNLTVRGATYIRHQRSIERTERTLCEQLVQYLNARGTRIDAVGTPGRLTASGLNKTSSSGVRADLPLAQPVSRVVRRPAPVFAPDDRRPSAVRAIRVPTE